MFRSERAQPSPEAADARTSAFWFVSAASKGGTPSDPKPARAIVGNAPETSTLVSNSRLVRVGKADLALAPIA